MLTIRLSRIGKKNQPYFRLIVSEKSFDPAGRFLEILGYYNPRSHPKIIQLKSERILYWLKQGAKTSDTVHNLLVSQRIVKGPKKKKGKTKLAKSQ